MMMTDNTVEADKNFDTNDTTNIVPTLKTEYTLEYIANIQTGNRYCSKFVARYLDYLYY